MVEQRLDRDGNDLLLLNTGNPFNCTGFISGLTYFSASLGSFKVSVWSVNDTDKYILQEEFTIEGRSREISTSVNLLRSVWLPFYPGNVMGVSFLTSPFVWSEAATSNGEATQWISWMLNDANPEQRDTADGTILDRAYSISAQLRGINKLHQFQTSIKLVDKSLKVFCGDSVLTLSPRDTGSILARLLLLCCSVSLMLTASSFAREQFSILET